MREVEGVWGYLYLVFTFYFFQNVLQNQRSDGKTDGVYTGECLLPPGKHGVGYIVKSVKVTFTVVSVVGSRFSRGLIVEAKATGQDNCTAACFNTDEHF